ncbi:hypothetical protein JTE90_017585 [Oedothorax gibbosus]|uniref:RING-type domain-containing protein n=1 Tax=Oedothorax gibbosus TaxID=931172 RepID=A0AAV6TKW8_9ARAC|nr:hypothetical protein JTE90_017585 [Oedothorax gibbosus]
MQCENSVTPFLKNVSSSQEELIAPMKLELNRLNTFQGKWPVSYVKPEQLAKHGFFYLQTDDRVQCAFCHIIVDDWNVGQKPLKEHIKKSPKCPFLLSSNVGNVPFVPPRPSSKVQTTSHSSLNFLNYKPKYPKMSAFEKRLDTFRNFPLLHVSARQLADCGFYYTGVATDDEVTCFFCGGALGHWEYNDEPWVEHAKFFPNCAHLKLQRQHRGLNSVSGSPATTSPPPDTTQAVEEKWIAEACHIFPKSLVEKVVLQHFEQTSRHFDSLTDLCAAVLECSTTDQLSEDMTGSTHQRIETEKKNDTHSCAHIRYEMKQSPGKYREYLLCKICMDCEMDTVFQPCGHLIACPTCAQVLTTCPLCRQEITSRLKTYMG